ncbi:MAG: MBG domain-containing protein, partial [Cyclobacteriaceae bacterium]|nr:MBG domain-containing protein [Cyclobacteriaceae bacterium]
MNRYLTFFLVTLLITFSTILLKAQTSPVFTSIPPTSGSYGSLFEYLISTDDAENDAREIILKSGILPMGLSLTDHLDGTAQLSGLALETGIFNLVISVQEVADPTQFSDQEISIEILKSILTVSANSTNRTYGEVNPFFSYTITGFKNGENEDELFDLPQISTLADQFSNAGSYDLIPYGASAVNYSFEYISGILIIEKASAEILVTDEIQNYDGFPKTITVTTNPSGLNFNVVYLNIPTTPTEPGSYEYQVYLDEVNYFGTSTGFFTINANPVSSGSIQVFMLEDAEPSSINL